MAEMQPLTMENINILPRPFRNFAGREDTYNRPGDRNFVIALPVDVANAMRADGWNVKTLRARDEDTPPQDYIEISVSYKVRPPKIFIITSRGRTAIDEDQVAMLDWAEIINADVVVNPYHWDINGRTGIKAYLGALYVTIHEGPLDSKYADIPLAN